MDKQLNPSSSNSSCFNVKSTINHNKPKSVKTAYYFYNNNSIINTKKKKKQL